MLVFSWGKQLHLIRVREERPDPPPPAKKGAQQPTKPPPPTLVFESGGKWQADYDILAIQWLNVQVCSLILA
jgi:hypothetical protein